MKVWYYFAASSFLPLVLLCLSFCFHSPSLYNSFHFRVLLKFFVSFESLQDLTHFFTNSVHFFETYFPLKRRFFCLAQRNVLHVKNDVTSKSLVASVADVVATIRTRRTTTEKLKFGRWAVPAEAAVKLARAVRLRHGVAFLMAWNFYSFWYYLLYYTRYYLVH